MQVEQVNVTVHRISEDSWALDNLVGIEELPVGTWVELIVDGVARPFGVERVEVLGAGPTMVVRTFVKRVVAQ
jgi:hypothetical protein